MSPRGAVRAAIVAASLFLSACTTVTVTRTALDGSGNGLRYYLPKPLLVVKPNNTGGYTVDIVNVPDPSHEYAIAPCSFLAKQDVSVVLAGGMLTKVTQQTYDPTVAKALIDDASAVAQTVIATQKADEAAARAKHESDRTALVTDLGKAITALRQAETDLRAKKLALDEANIALDGYKSVHPDPGGEKDPAIVIAQIQKLEAAVRMAAAAVEEARIALATATAQRDRLKSRLDALDGTTVVGTTTANKVENVADAAKQSSVGPSTVLMPSWGVFQIVQHPDPSTPSDVLDPSPKVELRKVQGFDKAFPAQVSAHVWGRRGSLAVAVPPAPGYSRSGEEYVLALVLNGALTVDELKQFHVWLASADGTQMDPVHVSPPATAGPRYLLTNADMEIHVPKDKYGAWGLVRLILDLAGQRLDEDGFLVELRPDVKQSAPAKWTLLSPPAEKYRANGGAFWIDLVFDQTFGPATTVRILDADGVARDLLASAGDPTKDSWFTTSGGRLSLRLATSTFKPGTVAIQVRAPGTPPTVAPLDYPPKGEKPREVTLVE